MQDDYRREQGRYRQDRGEYDRRYDQGMTRVTDRITARITGADMTAGTMGRMTEKDAQPDEKRKNISHL